MFNFKSFASVIASALVIGFSSPALAGSCDSVKEFAQEIEQISGKPTTVECYEQEPTPAQVPSREGAEVFLSMAALLAGGGLLRGILYSNKTQVKDWDYGFSSEPTSTPTPIVWWEEEEAIISSESNWTDEFPIEWEDLDISTIEWNDLDISDLSDIQWNDEEGLSSIIWWEDLI